MARFSWKNENELMARLTKAQNAMTGIDIMTFAGLCDSREELEAHVARYEQQVRLRASGMSNEEVAQFACGAQRRGWNKDTSTTDFHSGRGFRIPSRVGAQ